MNDCFNANESTPPMHTEMGDSDKMFQFIFYTICGGLVILLGLVGNILSAVVLHKDSQKPMSVLLLVLACYDFAFLFMSIFYIVYRSVVKMFPELLISPQYLFHVYRWVWYLGHVARTGRNWIIVVVAVDRFYVVRSPLSSASHNNLRRARIYSVAVTGLAVLYNLPRLWEWQKSQVSIPDPAANCSLVFSHELITPSDLGYFFSVFYVSILYCVFISVGPVALLVMFNTFLTVYLVNANKLRASMTSNMEVKMNDTRMLIIVIAVFLITETPGAIFQVLITAEKAEEIPHFWTYFQYLIDMGTVTNSSINFLIYCMCGQRFRKNLKVLIQGRTTRKSIYSHSAYRKTTNESVMHETNVARTTPNSSEDIELKEHKRLLIAPA